MDAKQSSAETGIERVRYLQDFLGRAIPCSTVRRVKIKKAEDN